MIVETKMSLNELTPEQMAAEIERLRTKQKLNKLLCLCGFHDWAFLPVGEFPLDEKLWYCQRCKRCEMNPWWDPWW